MLTRDDSTLAESGSQVLVTRVGLRIPAHLPFREWERAGQKLSRIVDSSSWCLGDWLVYGREHYSRRYQRTIDAVGLQYQTLRNYAWVAGQFNIGQRRESLSFQHHAEVASLAPHEREPWLDRAEQLQWTTKELRSHLQSARAAALVERDGAEPSNDGVQRRLEVPSDRFERWLKAAQRSGLDIEGWVVATLDRAAEKTLGEPLKLPEPRTDGAN